MSERFEYEEDLGPDFDDDGSEEGDDKINEKSTEVIKLVNVHKTYLLGLEGVPALSTL